MGISILLFFLVIIFSILFILGLFLLVIGSFEGCENEDFRETGIGLMQFPIWIIIFLVFCVISSVIYNAFSTTLTKEDIVGTYRIVKIEGLNISKESADLDSLVLRADNTYSITQIYEAGIERCTNETYTYNSDKQSLSMSKGMFELECGFRSFQIKYTCGDPDDGGVIIFEKIPK